MQLKPTTPMAEVLPLRARDACQNDRSQAAAPVEPPTAPVQQAVPEADRAFHAMLAHLSGGISPVALLLAYTDWLSHLATSPQRQIEISQDVLMGAKRLSERRHRTNPIPSRNATTVKRAATS